MGPGKFICVYRCIDLIPLLLKPSFPPLFLVSFSEILSSCTRIDSYTRVTSYVTLGYLPLGRGGQILVNCIAEKCISQGALGM